MINKFPMRFQKFLFAILLTFQFAIHAHAHGGIRVTARSIDEITRSNLKFIASEQIKKKNQFY